MLKMMNNRLRLARLWMYGAWISLISAGASVLAIHGATPGPQATNAAEFPVISKLRVHLDRPTLMMFLHPRCPCSVASVEELAHLMAQCSKQVDASVIVFKPSDQAESWGQTKATSDASAIPGVTISLDVDGALAKQLGVSTSGQVLLYDTGGRLLYAGGITGSRGHVGDNRGLDTLTDLILHQSPAAKTPTYLPVFGCAISSEGDKCSVPGNAKALK